ncbi:ATP-binding cassette domain-containing protein [Salinicoccus siamensis]|uniref:ATP-binding cassette domain-containing protein n=1 Tax=Salinicoccus siamensis TaxID=381830 RepID=UPI00360B82DD
MEPIVKYDDLHKSFGDTHVLKGINLDIYPSEKIAIIGPSGSGKTTIIRMLMTLEDRRTGISSWQVKFFGRWKWAEKRNGLMKKHLRSVRKNIGMVFSAF